MVPGASESRLWLVRHGLSGWNAAGRIQGQSPAAGGLTETGRDQAARAAQDLATRAPRASVIVASDLVRAAETAEIIAGVLRLPVEFDPELREQGLGSLEGTSAASGPKPDVLDKFWRDPYLRPPGGETVAEMYGRVHRALRRLTMARPGAEMIIVTHGGPVRVAMATSLPPPGAELPRSPVGNASISRWPVPDPVGTASAGTGPAGTGPRPAPARPRARARRLTPITS